MILLCNSPDEIPAVIGALEDYISPPSQLHLMRLRGQNRQEWDVLRASIKWQDASDIVATLSATPKFRLEG